MRRCLTVVMLEGFGLLECGFPDRFSCISSQHPEKENNLGLFCPVLQLSHLFFFFKGVWTSDKSSVLCKAWEEVLIQLWENTLPSSISWHVASFANVELILQRQWMAREWHFLVQEISLFFPLPAGSLCSILGKCLYSQRANSLLVWITPFLWLFLLVLLFSSFTKERASEWNLILKEKKKMAWKTLPVSYWAWTPWVPTVASPSFVHSIRFSAIEIKWWVLSLGSVRVGGLSLPSE